MVLHKKPSPLPGTRQCSINGGHSHYQLPPMMQASFRPQATALREENKVGSQGWGHGAESRLGCLISEARLGSGREASFKGANKDKEEEEEEPPSKEEEEEPGSGCLPEQSHPLCGLGDTMTRDTGFHRKAFTQQIPFTSGTAGPASPASLPALKCHDSLFWFYFIRP